VRVEAGELAGARATSNPRGTKRRLASERSDLLHLTRALGVLCDAVVDEIGLPGSDRRSPLRNAVWTARLAIYRAEKNKAERDRRTKR